MTRTRVHFTLLCFLLTLGTPLLAQDRPAGSPQPPPAVEAPDRTQQPAPSDYRFTRPIFRILQNYTLAKDDEVREIQVFFGDVTVEGRVQGNVLVVLGTLRLRGTGTIERSAVVVGGSAYVDEGGAIGRDFVVVGGGAETPSSFSPGGEHVIVGTPYFGEALQELLPWLTQGLLWGRLIVPDLDWVWIVVLVFLFTYLLMNTILDKPVSGSADVIGTRPVSAFFAGLLVLLLAVPVLAIVAASVIGLAIIPFLICGLVVAAMIGKTAVARAIGRGVIRPELPEGRLTSLFAFLIGFAVLTIAYMVPLLGFVTWAMTSVLGLGAATATLRSHLRRERKVPPFVPPPSSPIEPTFREPVPAGTAIATSIVEPGLQSSAVASSDLPRRESPNTELPNSRTPEPPSYQTIEPPNPQTTEPPTYRATEPPNPGASAYTAGLARYPRAVFLDRLAAFVLDCVLVAIANALLNRHNDDGFYFFLLMAYHIAFWAWKGTTLGGIIINLRVIRTDGGDPKPADAVIRGLSGIFSIVALGIGYLWMLQDPEKQTWHDKIAGTLVVKVPRELVLQ